MIFDTHAHYDDEAFDGDRPELLERLKEAGVGAVMNVAASLGSCRSTLKLAEAYDWIYGAMGVHPSETGELDQEGLQWIKEQCGRRKIKAVGEIGLDYYWEEPAHDIQKKWFEAQMDLARQVKLPVIIHSRDAAKDTLDMMKAASRGYRRRRPLLFLHQGNGQGVPEHGIFPWNRRRPYLQQCKEAERGGGVYTSGVHCIGDRLSLSGAGPNRGKRNSSLKSSLCGGGCQPA